MNRERTDLRTCNCEKLGGMAHLKLTYLEHSSGFEAMSQFDCEDSEECGVSTRKSSLEWTFDFPGKCPIYQEMTRKK